MSANQKSSTLFQPLIRIQSNVKALRIARQLRAYDDFMLRDMGLNRSDLDRASSLSLWASDELASLSLKTLVSAHK